MINYSGWISGTRRRKVLVPHDSTALLNQLRMEEKERERELRRQVNESFHRCDFVLELYFLSIHGLL